MAPSSSYCRSKLTCTCNLNLHLLLNHIMQTRYVYSDVTWTEERSSIHKTRLSETELSLRNRPWTTTYPQCSPITELNPAALALYLQGNHWCLPQGLPGVCSSSTTTDTNSSHKATPPNGSCTYSISKLQLIKVYSTSLSFYITVSLVLQTLA